MSRKMTEDARLLAEALETAEGMLAYGVLSKLDLAKIQVVCAQPPKYSPEQVVSIRTKTAKMSQAVFASFLNVSVSTVQKWESPAAKKHPSGAAAKLLQLVEAKGVNALIT